MNSPFQFCTVLSVNHFQAPPVDRVNPNRIQPGMELVELVLSGVVIHETRGEDLTLGCGAMFWEREGDWTLSRTSAEAPYSCLAVHFSMQADPPVAPPFLTRLGDPRQARLIAEDLMRGFHRDGIERGLFSVSAYTRLACAALSSGTPQPLDDQPEPLRNVLAYIPEHLADDLSMPKLAAVAGLSETRLHQIFRENLGTTPHQWILEQRLQESRVLLARGAPLVKQVSADCGFASVEVFCRNFRKRFDLSPGHYRDLYEGMNVPGVSSF